MTKILFMGRKRLSANLLRLLSSQDGIEIVSVLTDSHLQGSPTTAAAKELGLQGRNACLLQSFENIRIATLCLKLPYGKKQYKNPQKEKSFLCFFKSSYHSLAFYRIIWG